MKQSFKMLAFISIAIQSTFAFAYDNQCANFNIEISNLTPETCVLMGQDVRRGDLNMLVPSAILPNDSQSFSMTQTTTGPEIALSYFCGIEIIRFSSKQNLCLFEAGDISGKVLDPQPEYVRVTYAVTTGSFAWSKPGIIHWMIAPKFSDSIESIT